jgi:hypothetical protein
MQAKIVFITDKVRPYYKCVIISPANFLSNVTNQSRQRDSQIGFLSSFSFHQTKLRTRIKLGAFILAGKSAVPSHEACRCREQSHPQLAVCTVNQPSHFSDADGGLGVDMYLLW